jgi:hypothetical protein
MRAYSRKEPLFYLRRLYLQVRSEEGDFCDLADLRYFAQKAQSASKQPTLLTSAQNIDFTALRLLLQ